MGKSKDKTKTSSTLTKPETDQGRSSAFSLSAPEKAIDPSLASLFGSSLGPVKPSKRKSKKKAEQDEAIDSETSDGRVSSQGHGEEGVDESVEGQDDSQKPAQTSVVVQLPERRKKRKRGDQDDLEGRFLQQLKAEEEHEYRRAEETMRKRLERRSGPRFETVNESEGSKDGEPDAHSRSGDVSDGDSDVAVDEGEDSNRKEKPDTAAPPILHETLQNRSQEDLEKSARTIFLGNVSSTAVSSKASYKTLKKFFSVPGKIESLRFRSIAFSEQIPRKAAFVTHKLHEKQQTVNAYVVYKTKEAAREALKLNGNIVLDRHIRVDSIAHPAKHDTQRCIFIGNLDFEAQEESLWRHFTPCGKIESVRIIRDAKTNVGKGFAYVQFEDGISVEQALLLNGKKMQNDRELRISRAKNIKRKNKSAEVIPRAPPAKRQKTSIYVPKDNPQQKEMLGRARKLLGKAGAAQVKRTPESFVFEGVRATSKSNPGVKLGGNRKGGKARGKARATERSVSWKNKKNKDGK